MFYIPNQTGGKTIRFEEDKQVQALPVGACLHPFAKIVFSRFIPVIVRLLKYISMTTFVRFFPSAFERLDDLCKTCSATTTIIIITNALRTNCYIYFPP